MIELPDNGPWKRIERIGDAVLLLGDCLDILPLLPKVGALITDPPYGCNLGKHRGANDTRPSVLHKDGYESYDDTPENFQNVVVPALHIALSLCGRAAVFMSVTSAWKLPAPDAMGGIYLPSAMGRNSWGYSSISHFLLYGSAPNLNFGAKATAIYSTEVSEKNGHPVPKPLGWMTWLVSLASTPHEIVLDPFMGSGTTGVACMNLGRKFIGTEIEPKYFDIACERIENAQRQAKLFEEPTSKPEQLEII